MSDYKIKLEDKAAFLNRLEKQGVAVDSFDIKDNKLKGYFEFTVNDPQANNIIKTILRQSPKINKINEMKTKITKKQLAEIIREELAEAGYEKKETPMNENLQDLLTNPVFVGPLVAFLTAGGAITASLLKDLKNAKTPEDRKKVLDSAARGIGRKMSGDE